MVTCRRATVQSMKQKFRGTETSKKKKSRWQPAVYFYFVLG